MENAVDMSLWSSDRQKSLDACGKCFRIIFNEAPGGKDYDIAVTYIQMMNAYKIECCKYIVRILGTDEFKTFKNETGVGEKDMYTWTFHEENTTPLSFNITMTVFPYVLKKKQANTPNTITGDDGIKRFEIMKIQKAQNKNGIETMMVYWKGKSSLDFTWEPRESLLEDVPNLVHQFDAGVRANNLQIKK